MDYVPFTSEGTVDGVKYQHYEEIFNANAMTPVEPDPVSSVASNTKPNILFTGICAMLSLE